MSKFEMSSDPQYLTDGNGSEGKSVAQHFDNSLTKTGTQSSLLNTSHETNLFSKNQFKIPPQPPFGTRSVGQSISKGKDQQLVNGYPSVDFTSNPRIQNMPINSPSFINNSNMNKPIGQSKSQEFSPQMQIHPINDSSTIVDRPALRSLSKSDTNLINGGGSYSPVNMPSIDANSNNPDCNKPSASLLKPDLLLQDRKTLSNPSTPKPQFSNIESTSNSSISSLNSQPSFNEPLSKPTAAHKFSGMSQNIQNPFSLPVSPLDSSHGTSNEYNRSLTDPYSVKPVQFDSKSSTIAGSQIGTSSNIHFTSTSNTVSQTSTTIGQQFTTAAQHFSNSPNVAQLNTRPTVPGSASTRPSGMSTFRSTNNVASPTPIMGSPTFTMGGSMSRPNQPLPHMVGQVSNNMSPYPSSASTSGIRQTLFQGTSNLQVGPQPMSVISPSNIRQPQMSMTGPTSMMAPSSLNIGAAQTQIRPPPPTTMLGPQPNSMMSSSNIRPPPTSKMISPNIGPSPMSRLSSPLNIRSPSSNIGPQPSMLTSPSNIGPPPTSMMTSPSNIGPPPMSMMASAKMGPPQTSFNAPPNIGQSPNTMRAPNIGAPPTSMMAPPSNIGPPPTSMMAPPANIGPPPTSMMAPPSNIGPPPMSMKGPSSTIGAKPPPPMVTSSPSFSFGGSNSGARYPPQQPAQHVDQMNQVSQQLGGLTVTQDGWNRSWGLGAADLLKQKMVLPPKGVIPPKISLLQDYLPNCSPDIFRCTIAKIPESQSVLQKSRLPFGIVIHPFKDLDHLAVVSCNTIVRCRSCRTYINPFVVFKGERRWECNLCFRVNELPDEFHFDPVSRTYGDPSRRPEVRESTIEFIAPQEYMLRPPQPATYVWVLDVSRQAIETGYLKVVCDTLLSLLDRIPGDKRTLIGFITFSTTIQFYLMGEGQQSVQMLEVGDVDDVFIPTPHDLLVNLDENKSLVEELLASLPEAHANSVHTQTAFGAALNAAYKLVSHIGGRITAMTALLPTIGPGALKPREDPNERSSKDIGNLGPATDFYKKLALDCSGQQVAVDLFTFNSQYVDLATLSGISRFSGGCMHHFPGFNASKNPTCVEPFKLCLTRYITRKIGFEAVMRIRATRGISIINFHGNFFVRSTDLLSLPNINPDAGFGMQVSIEEPLHNIRQACFQAALLYTSSKGERRIRVHTLCLPVSPNVSEIIVAGDQQAIVDLLAKMAVDKCLSSQMSDAREAIINACTDILCSYKMSLSPGLGELPAPSTLQILPLYLLALLKSVALRHGISTKLDDRLFAMCELKTLPLKYLIQTLYPDLYPIHNINEEGALNIDDCVVPQPDRMHLSAEYIDRGGAYLMDAYSVIYVYIRSGISSEWVNDVLAVPSYAAIPQPLYEDPFPIMDNPTSELVRNFVFHLQREKPYSVPIYIIREDNPLRSLFIQNLVDDRSEGAHSYVEFLQYIRSQTK